MISPLFPLPLSSPFSPSSPPLSGWMMRSTPTFVLIFLLPPSMSLSYRMMILSPPLVRSHGVTSVMNMKRMNRSSTSIWVHSSDSMLRRSMNRIIRRLYHVFNSLRLRLRDAGRVQTTRSRSKTRGQTEFNHTPITPPPPRRARKTDTPVDIAIGSFVRSHRCRSRGRAHPGRTIIDGHTCRIIMSDPHLSAANSIMDDVALPCRQTPIAPQMLPMASLRHRGARIININRQDAFTPGITFFCNTFFSIQPAPPKVRAPKRMASNV